jgi:hypothetical protein
VKKLKLREVITGKLLYGGLRNENNPSFNNNLIKFPVDSESGMPTTYVLGSKPYAEVSAGIANIFKVVRVDVVRRLTYLDNPDVSAWGIRTRVKFDF